MNKSKLIAAVAAGAAALSLAVGKHLGILLIMCAIVVSCRAGRQGNDIEVEEILFESYKKTEAPLNESKMKWVETIELRDGGKADCAQMTVSKILWYGNRYWVLDTVQNTLVVYDDSGEAIARVGIRGRGPQEYLKISDFTITDRGEVVLLDGNQDVLIFYDHELKFIRKEKLKRDISRLMGLESGLYLMNISSWETKGNEFKVILADEAQTEQKGFIENDGLNDPNYEFPYIGFSGDAKDGIFFLKPIDDNVYLFDKNGLKTRYHFDFGVHTVKESYRKEIEKNQADVFAGTFLVNSVYVAKNYCLGIVFERGNFYSFYLDKQSSLRYDLTSYGYFMGCNEGYAFFYVFDPMGKQEAIRINKISFS